jgi:hypothetical protein
MGLASVLLFVMIFVPLYSCDMSVFVQSEFSERCQLLIDLCDRTDLATRLSHPDRLKHSGELSREWVRFYLAHGKHLTIPPTLAFIATDSWNTAMNDMGMAVAEIIRNDYSPETLECLRLRLNLLKKPDEIEKVQKNLQQRKAFVTAGNSGSNLQIWLENALIKPAEAIGSTLTDSPYLVERIQVSVNTSIDAFKRLEKNQQDLAREVTDNLFSALKQEMDNEFSFWQNLFFYSTL